ncbi:isocitrate lyase/PEP mutase family protein [Fictibacillus enclensis]|uniref:isocitrate lyase/PEP mutase family protein n=1 Tax=Fictibacillus enclensis TaxID=1017270 RepID=UPI0025A190AC|nr:isocitrate lyase/PEP mutase family protein [Fictibacillus enclensis]MDM5336623.1 isocitrate lyase/PEP mutase family protein [Fictibacillus enclensis]
MRKTTQLKELLNAKEILIMPGAYDALSAKLIEHTGFQATQATGYGIAATILGKPDIGILSMGQMLEQTRNIIQSVNIPVMADGDNGFGNAVNVYHTVQYFEQAGAAGINLEDQVFPKRCGHLNGKQVIPEKEMILKVKAAVEAKKDPDFIINARTDAIAQYGVEEAVKRGNAYAEAGADIIFVDAPESIDQIKYVIDHINAPVSINMTEGGKTPIITVDELEALGAVRVSFPVTTVLSAARAMKETLLHLQEFRRTTDIKEKFMDFHDFTGLLGMEKIREIERKYLPEEILLDKYGLEANRK